MAIETSNSNLKNDSNLSNNISNQDEFLKWEKEMFLKIKRNLWLLPFLNAFLMPMICLIPYLLIANSPQVYWWLPFVSDAGAITPGANVFSQLMDIASFSMSICMYARYRQIRYYLTDAIPLMVKKKELEKPDSTTLKILSRVNLIGLLMTWLSAWCGMTLGNIRCSEDMTIHSMNSSTMFTMLFLYMLLSIYVCEKLYQLKMESRPISMTLNTLVYSVVLFLFCYYLVMAPLEYGDLNIYWDNVNRQMWTPEMPGFTSHYLCSVFEWGVIILLSPFFLCLSQRMRLFKHWDQVQM